MCPWWWLLLPPSVLAFPLTRSFLRVTSFSFLIWKYRRTSRLLFVLSHSLTHKLTTLSLNDKIWYHNTCCSIWLSFWCCLCNHTISSFSLSHHCLQERERERQTLKRRSSFVSTVHKSSASNSKIVLTRRPSPIHCPFILNHRSSKGSGTVSKHSQVHTHVAIKSIDKQDPNWPSQFECFWQAETWASNTPTLILYTSPASLYQVESTFFTR